MLELGDIEPELAEKIAGLVSFSVNGYTIPTASAKKNNNANFFTIIPVRVGQPLTIEMAIHRGNATALLDLAKTKTTLPGWSNSSLVNPLDLFSSRITYNRVIPHDEGSLLNILPLILFVSKQY